jgi:hypothetical protein
MIIHSKFDFIQMALQYNRTACHVVWVDAGITRIAGKLENIEKCSVNRQITFLVELSATKNIDLKALMRGKSPLTWPVIGSSKRLIGGSLIYVSNSEVESMYNQVISIRNEWFQNGLWDSEQVFLCELVRVLEDTRFYVQRRGTPTSMLSDLSQNHSKRITSSKLSKYLVHGIKFKLQASKN